MVGPFEFSEIDPQDRIFIEYPNLKIGNSPAFYLILRGIIGNIQIKQTFREVTFAQITNLLLPTENSFATFDDENPKNIVSDELNSGIIKVLAILKSNCKSNLCILPEYISDTFSLKDLSDVLDNRNIIYRNKTFFESLNHEFCNFYYHSNNKSHTLAFLHLYRVLEYISYTFPVMYTTSTKDFSKSFEELKTLFSGEKDKGELAVFKKFIAHVMNDEKDYKLLSIEIDILSGTEEYNHRIYTTIMSICDKGIFYEAKNIQNSRISVRFPDFSSFIITIRNRFFHLKNSQENNIHSVDIVDSDFFFSLINRKCAYFLSLVTLNVIKRSCFQ